MNVLRIVLIVIYVASLIVNVIGAFGEEEFGKGFTKVFAAVVDIATIHFLVEFPH